VDPSCGGEEVEVSLLSGKFYKNCEASSQFAGGLYDCQYAFSGKMMDEPNQIWASNGEGVSAWIQVNFKGPVQVTSIQYLNKANPGERNKAITIRFSDGSHSQVQLRNTQNIVPLEVQPTITKSVRFTIDQVYSSINNGGAFKIMGVPCLEEEGIVHKEQSNKIKLKCHHNIANNDAIQKRNYAVGDEFIAYCSDSCVGQQD